MSIAANSPPILFFTAELTSKNAASGAKANRAAKKTVEIILGCMKVRSNIRIPP